MKTIIITIIIIFTSSLLPAQSFELQHTVLRGMDRSAVSSKQVIEKDTLTLIVLWGHFKSDDVEKLDKIQAAWNNKLRPRGVKMAVICQGHIISKNQLKSIADDYDWSFSIYFDYEGDFLDGINVSITPAILFASRQELKICHQHMNCAGKINLICDNILENIDSQSQLIVRKFDSTGQQSQMPPSCNMRSW